MYLEGADFGYNNRTTAIYPMFGCSYIGDGNPSSTGNVSTVTGQTGSIADGVNYGHLYQQGPDNYVSYIGTAGGTLFFRSQDNNGRAINYNGSTGNYRSIHSTFVVGALRNGTYSKLQLMQIYMDYLLSYIGSEETKSDVVSDLMIHPNLGRNINISFTLVRPVNARINIYNIAGQKVRALLNSQRAPGFHNVIFNGLDDKDCTLSDGTYIVRIEYNDTVTSKVIVLIK